MKLGRLEKAGIDEPWKVPLYLPTSYIDCREVLSNFDYIPSFVQDVVVVGRYKGDLNTQMRPSRFGGKMTPLSTGTLIDENCRELKFSFFGNARAFEERLANEADQVVMRGSPVVTNGRLYLNSPSIMDTEFIGRVIPVYPGVPRLLSPDTARKLIASLLDETIPFAAQRLRIELNKFAKGTRLREILGSPRWTLDEVLAQVHYPSSLEEGDDAQEILMRASAIVSVIQLKSSSIPTAAEREPIIFHEWKSLLKRVPFKLTDEQTAGIERLMHSFAQPITSTTLVNGDVGMGKSIIYQVAIAAIAKAGGRAAVLLPNERLANQAFDEINALWPELEPVLVNRKQKDDLIGKKILVGTTALLFRDVGHLDVFVTDEQHRFSVDQRAALASDKTHLIEMSATPIPRTQAILTYGSMNVIRLSKRHSEQDIHTKIVTRQEASRMVDHIKQMVVDGDRVLIVCPRKEQQDPSEDVSFPIPSVQEVAEKWERLFPGRIRIVHSDTPEDEARQNLADIKSGAASVVVATTVLECGLTIEGLRALVVVHAERFGVAQLHQLRGRLSRHGGYGVCYLYIPRPVGERAFARLSAVAATNDGFKLSELDMSLRGFGDLSVSGQKQHGSATSIIFNKEVPVDVLQEMIEYLPE